MNIRYWIVGRLGALIVLLIAFGSSGCVVTPHIAPNGRVTAQVQAVPIYIGPGGYQQPQQPPAVVVVPRPAPQPVIVLVPAPQPGRYQCTFIKNPAHCKPMEGVEEELFPLEVPPVPVDIVDFAPASPLVK